MNIEEFYGKNFDGIDGSPEFMRVWESAKERGLVDPGVEPQHLRYWRNESGDIYATSRTMVERAVELQIEYESGYGYHFID